MSASLGFPSTRILVTGAAGGIGRELVAAFLSEGATVCAVVSSAQREFQLREFLLERQINSEGLTCFPANLASEAEIESLVGQVLETFIPDLLVNCAGIFGQEGLKPWQEDPRLWQRTLFVNTVAPFLLAHFFVPRMLEQGGGRILDLSTGAAVTDRADSNAYWVSKTALARLGSCLHEAGYEEGLRVLELSPGVVFSPMTQGLQMHRERSNWTSPALVCDIACAFARGELDALSGSYVRAGSDSLETLVARASRGVLSEGRRLRLTPFED